MARSPGHQAGAGAGSPRGRGQGRGVIEVLAVSKCYGPKVGVQDITFRVGRGEILGLLGPNGAGKTTTLRLITGYLVPSRGTIRIGGCDLWDDPTAARRQIGYLPDRPPVYRDMTVRDFVTFAAALRGVPRAARRRRVDETLTLTGLAHVQGRLVGNLSRGYQQRVGLAQAIVHDPAVLVLDEPTVGLDPRQIHEIRELIRRLGQDRTVILSSHILPEVQALCHRVLIMDRGRVLAEGTPQRLAEALRQARRYRIEVQGEPAAAAALLRSVPGVQSVAQEGGAFVVATAPEVDVRPDLFYRLAAARMPLLALVPLDLSLEDVFLRLVTTEGAAAQAGAEAGAPATAMGEVAAR